MARKRKNRKFQHEQQPVYFDEQHSKPRKKPPPLRPQTENQAKLLNNLHTKVLTFAIGPAGTGKSYVSTRFACELLEEREIEKIIVTRPAVSAEDDMGHLPGVLADKFAPFFAPIREIMEDHLGTSHVENLIKLGRIEIAPIGFLRGHTFRNCFVLFDEAQNANPKQMKMFLTRIGKRTTVCVDGDLEQMDRDGPSGLLDALERFSCDQEVGITKFTDNEVVRSGFAKKVVQAYK